MIRVEGLLFEIEKAFLDLFADFASLCGGGLESYIVDLVRVISVVAARLGTSVELVP
jgi:hypothetical protein